MKSYIDYNQMIVFIFIMLCFNPYIVFSNTAYFEKYYSARRTNSIKQPQIVKCNFYLLIQLNDFSFGIDRPALIGDHELIGRWKVANSILMNTTQEYNIWKASLYLPVNTTIKYRYLIAFTGNESEIIQIRFWESNANARSLTVNMQVHNQTDIFGIISDHKIQVQRGWLNNGHIIQFKIFRNALILNNSHNKISQMRLKLEPIDQYDFTSILPSSRAYTEHSHMNYGESVMKAQSEFGVTYKSNDTLIFQIILTNIRDAAYLLKLFALGSKPYSVHLIGSQYIMPDHIKNSEGTINLNIVSSIWLNVFGTLTIKYLVINPFPHTLSNLYATFTNYWNNNWKTLHIGHRGIGSTLKSLSNMPQSQIIENTIASMKASANMGADMVQFEVHLTSDLIPIVYYDFSIYVCMDSKKPTNKDDLIEVFLKDITYEQLKNLKTYQIIGNKIIEYAPHNVANEDHQLFPTLDNFLNKINNSVGFVIEIKWPQQRYNSTHESIQTIDKNLYVDKILNVIMQHGCGRFIILTSFDADICTLLRYKQNAFPVIFIIPNKQMVYEDPRSDDIYNAIKHIQTFDLSGISVNVMNVKNNFSILQFITNQKKKVFIWGVESKMAETIRTIESHRPHGIVVDRIDLMLSMNRTNTLTNISEDHISECSVSN